jgi:hypothetical protein
MITISAFKWVPEFAYGQVRDLIGKEEPRRALTHIGCDNLRLGLLLEPVLDFRGRVRRRLDAAAFRHLNFDQDRLRDRIAHGLAPEARLL